MKYIKITQKRAFSNLCIEKINSYLLKNNFKNHIKRQN